MGIVGRIFGKKPIPQITQVVQGNVQNMPVQKPKPPVNFLQENADDYGKRIAGRVRKGY
jgi:hypothetical protein